MNCKEEIVELQVKYIEDEIEIRIESIKIELEMLHEKLKNDLNNFKNDLLMFELPIYSTELHINISKFFFIELSSQKQQINLINKKLLHYEENVKHLGIELKNK